MIQLIYISEMAMKTSFCCANLYTGSLIVGWLSMVYTVILAIITIGEIVDKETHKDDATDWDVREQGSAHNDKRKLNDRAKYTIISLIIGMCVSINISLLYGTYKKRSGFLMPFMVFSGLKVLSIFFAVIGEFAYETVGMIVLTFLLDIPVTVYFIAVVASYYVELRSDSVQPPKYEP